MKATRSSKRCAEKAAMDEILEAANRKEPERYPYLDSVVPPAPKSPLDLNELNNLLAQYGREHCGIRQLEKPRHNLFGDEDLDLDVTGIHYVPITCPNCEAQEEDTRKMLIHIVVAHFPSEHDYLQQCGLVSKEVQEILDKAVANQLERSVFKKTFTGNAKYVFVCPANSKLVRYFFDANVKFFLKEQKAVEHSVMFVVLDQDGIEHEAWAVFDGQMKECEATKKTAFLSEFVDLTYTKNLEEEVIQHWSVEKKASVCKLLKICQSADDATIASEIKNNAPVYRNSRDLYPVNIKKIQK